MHIAFLTPEYPHKLSTPSGGLGTSIQSIAEALVKHDVRVSIFIYGQKKDEVLEESKIKLHFIAQREYNFIGWYRYRKYLQRYVQEFIEKDCIDIVEVPDWTGISAFINLSCPVVMRLNGSDAYFCHLERRQQKFKNRFFEKRAFKKAHKIISVSDFTGEVTNKIYGTNRVFEVIPNSVNTDEFSPDHTKTTRNTLLYFGTLIRKKGILELAEIFNYLIARDPEIELILIGRDTIDIFEKISTLEIFRELLTDNAKGKVKYLGSLPYGEIRDKIVEATVIALPSFAEALPMTWLETMALEKPLVSSNIGWANEIMIDGKTGFVVDPKKHEVFADKIYRLIENENLRKEMGTAARNYVCEKFSSEVIGPKNLDFYNSVINKSI